MRTLSKVTSVIAACAIACAALVAMGSPAGAATHRAVIFVHGLSGMGPTIWSEMKEAFKAKGYADSQIDVWQYDWTKPNTETAKKLAGEVDRLRAKTGADKIDIVAHSMGSLSSRYYLKFLGGNKKVVHWISIGGVNHGTIASFACPWTSCRDLKQNSPMIKKLNSGSETPGPVKYETQSSTCDELAVPHSTVPLKGAKNIKVGCLEHISMPRHASVINATLAFLAS